MLALQSEVPITEEVEGEETEGNGQSRDGPRVEAQPRRRHGRRVLLQSPRRHEESDEQSDQDDTDERAGWRRLAVASVGGTAMFLGYLCASWHRLLPVLNLRVIWRSTASRWPGS
ncbi:hypothetical protein ACODNH_00620 (plasmid) [Haloarcula sp. NS06]|uniref:hypothetical protein n=1 Tax=Haloarcula sp. NS06 TaxID=3409688 RepID=UPI003DA767CF